MFLCCLATHSSSIPEFTRLVDPYSSLTFPEYAIDILLYNAIKNWVRWGLWYACVSYPSNNIPVSCVVVWKLNPFLSENILPFWLPQSICGSSKYLERCEPHDSKFNTWRYDVSYYVVSCFFGQELCWFIDFVLEFIDFVLISFFISHLPLWGQDGSQDVSCSRTKGMKRGCLVIGQFPLLYLGSFIWNSTE